MSTPNRYNVVIVGKTGAGKSSLINYLYGKTVVESGVGKPVTVEGFHPIDFQINGLPVRIFDSWGLEVGKADQWMESLNEELKKRGTNLSAENWFHSVFYCINAADHRIQSFDVKIIKKFFDEKYKVSVVFTKSDTVDEEDVEKLKQILREQCGIKVPVIEASIGANRRGAIIPPFGKVDIEKQAYKDFWDSIILRLPERCEILLLDEIGKWEKKQLDYLDSVVEKGGLEIDDVSKEIKRRTEEFLGKLKGGDGMFFQAINGEIKKTLDIYGEFSAALNYPPASMLELLATDFHSEFSPVIKFDFIDLFFDVFDWEEMSKGVVNYLENIWLTVEMMSKKPEKRRDEFERKISEFCDGLRGGVKGMNLKIRNILKEISKKNFDESQGLADGLLFLK